MTVVAATCIVVALTVFHSGIVSASHWQYEDEENWPEACKEGTKQSPIALSPDIADEKEFSAFIFEMYNGTYPVQLKNNGHSAEIRLHVEIQPSVKGGALPHVYVLDHLHFHWQSEHTINNYRFPLELHLVHYGNIYKNLSEALKYRDGVAVFAILFDLSPDNDKEFEPLISVIDKLHDKINEIEQMTIKLEDFLPRDRAGFYRYNGSLTTPDCTEGVIWTVLTNTLPISKNQVKSFSQMQTEDKHTLARNYRSLQQLNGRIVHMKVSPVRGSSAANKLYRAYNFIFILILFITLMQFV